MDDEQQNNADELTTINDLNDDCLACIFQYIQDLPNQIQIVKCCQRFREIMARQWKMQSKNKCLMLEDLRRTLSNSGDRKHYLTAMRKEFDSLWIYKEILGVFRKEMKAHGIHCFPCAEKCFIMSWNPLVDCYVDDRDMKALSQLVPNLKQLEIYGAITGKHIIDFQYIEKLVLYDGNVSRDIPKIGIDNLRDIFLNLKNLKVLDVRSRRCSELRLIPEVLQCSRLQVLKLDLSTLKSVIDQVLQLPELKKLIVRLGPAASKSINIIYEFDQIIQRKGPQIQGVAVDCGFLPDNSSWQKYFKMLRPENLKYLVLGGRIFNGNEYATCHFERLELLCLTRSKFQTTDILKMLPLCPVLKHLDISNCSNLGVSFLNDISNYWKTEKPNQVLTIYYNGTSMESDITKNCRLVHSHLRLLNSDSRFSGYDFSYAVQEYAFQFD